MTPGYFQVENNSCTYSVMYLPHRRNHSPDNTSVYAPCYKEQPGLLTPEGLVNTTKLLLSNIDLNR